MYAHQPSSALGNGAKSALGCEAPAAALSRPSTPVDQVLDIEKYLTMSIGMSPPDATAPDLTPNTIEQPGSIGPHTVKRGKKQNTVPRKPVPKPPAFPSPCVKDYQLDELERQLFPLKPKFTEGRVIPRALDFHKPEAPAEPLSFITCGYCLKHISAHHAGTESLDCGHLVHNDCMHEFMLEQFNGDTQAVCKECVPTQNSEDISKVNNNTALATLESTSIPASIAAMQAKSSLPSPNYRPKIPHSASAPTKAPFLQPSSNAITSGSSHGTARHAHATSQKHRKDRPQPLNILHPLRRNSEGSVAPASTYPGSLQNLRNVLTRRPASPPLEKDIASQLSKLPTVSRPVPSKSITSDPILCDFIVSEPIPRQDTSAPAKKAQSGTKETRLNPTYSENVILFGGISARKNKQTENGHWGSSLRNGRSRNPSSKSSTMFPLPSSAQKGVNTNPPWACADLSQLKSPFHGVPQTSESDSTLRVSPTSSHSSETSEHASISSSTALTSKLRYHETFSNIEDPSILSTFQLEYPLRCFSTMATHVDERVAHVVFSFEAPPAPRGPQFGFDYRTGALDVRQSVELQNKVGMLTFDQRKLSAIPLGGLRIYTSAKLVTPNSFIDVDVYMFQNLLVVVRGSEVVAAIDSKLTLRSGSVSSNNSRCLRLKFKNGQDVQLLMASRAEAFIWHRAVNEALAEFPIDPKKYNAYLDTVEQDLGLAEKENKAGVLPSEIVLCLPDSALSPRFQAELVAIMRSLGTRTRVSVVVYTELGHVAVQPLQNPRWKGWPAFLASFKGANRWTSSPDLASIMDEAKEALHDDEQHNMGTTSIVLVAEEKMDVESSLLLFKDSDIAVSAIAVGPRADCIDLSRLAGSTGGAFAHAQDGDYELWETLARMLEWETQYVFRKLVIRTFPRVGAKITKIYNNAFGKRGISESSDRSAQLSINVGRLRAGEIKCVVLEVAENVLPGAPLFQSVLEVTRDEVKHVQGLQPMTPVEGVLTMSMAITKSEYVLARLREVLGTTLDSLVQENKAEAISALHNGIRELAVHSQQISEHGSAFTEIQHTMDLVSQELHGLLKLYKGLAETNALKRATLEFLWLLDQKKSMRLNTPLKRHFVWK